MFMMSFIHFAIASLALDFMERWSIYPAFQFNSPDYWIHLASQMYFYNIVPCSSSISSSHSQQLTPSHFKIDVASRLEHRKEALSELKKEFPSLASHFPTLTKNGNTNEGRNIKKYKKDEISYSCELAWRLYDYFVQDFVCFGYELPPQCLKKECRKDK